MRFSSVDIARIIPIEPGVHPPRFVFRVERIKNGLHECERALAAAAEILEAPRLESDAVREVSASLARLES